MISAWVMSLVVAAEGVAPATGGGDPGFVLQGEKFPYPSAQAALDALLENRNAVLTVKKGWTLVDEVANGAHVNWAFTPEHHPAHPSVVRRTPMEQGGEIRVGLMYRCDARNQAACAGLLQEFRDFNAEMTQEFKRRLGRLDHPRKVEALAFAERYLDSIDQGRDDESLAMLPSYSRTGYTPAAWRLDMEKLRAHRGTLTLRRLLTLEWFDNPPGVELAGTFAFLEFETLYDTGKDTGGYSVQRVVLHSDKGAPFRVMKDEAPFLRLIAVRRRQ